MLIGPDCAGKTSLVHRLVRGVFESFYDPTIEDIFM